MLKKELKDGMVVKTREGHEYFILHELLIRQESVYDFKRSNHLSNYWDTLTHLKNNLMDIMQVFDKDYNLLWERDETDWTKVEVDTKVLVMDLNNKWEHRHFAYTKDNKIYCYPNGTTSWTVEQQECTEWLNVKLYKEDK